MNNELDVMKSPVSAESPAGENQEYNSLYLGLEELASGTPSRQMGSSVVDGRDPDWKGLKKNCLELWKKTRDLRVAMYLVMSKTLTEGLSGFAEGMDLVQYLVTDQWDSFWPALDPDDDNDPLERLNILAMISPRQGSYDDPYQFINHFRGLRLTTKLPYTFRDMLIVSGELEAGEKAVDSALFGAEMSGVPIQEFLDRKTLVETILAELDAVTTAFNEKTQGRGNLNFSSIQAELKLLLNFYGKYTNRTPEPENVEISKDTETSGPENHVKKQGTHPRSFANLSEIHPATRSEALLLLKKSAEYFQVYEPTSPVPFLLNRALRMAEMNFLDLLAEIDSNALSRGKEQFGVVTPIKEQEDL